MNSIEIVGGKNCVSTEGLGEKNSTKREFAFEHKYSGLSVQMIHS